MFQKSGRPQTQDGASRGAAKMFKRTENQNASQIQNIAMAAQRLISANSSNRNGREGLTTAGETTALSKENNGQRLLSSNKSRGLRQRGGKCLGQTHGSAFFQQQLSMLDYNPRAPRRRGHQQCSLAPKDWPKDDEFESINIEVTKEKYPLPSDKEFFGSSGGAKVDN